MNDKKISIIVPVYNVEDFVGKCIESILNQSYKNLEIILVDDGSTDNSGKICDEYATRDSRIKVIHKENGGPSAARNMGLDVASGEYISFVDSDDFIHPQMYGTLTYSIEKENADISMGFIKLVDSYDKDFQAIDKDSYTVKAQTEYWNMGYESKENASQTVMCPGKLYRRDIVENIRFQLGSYHEDVIWFADYIQNIKKAVVYTESMYFYYQRPGSRMNSICYQDVADSLDAVLYRLEVCKKCFHDSYESDCLRFKKAYYKHFYKINNMDIETGTKVKKLYTKHSRKHLEILSSNITKGQKLTIMILKILATKFVITLSDYNFDISEYVKRHIRKGKK